MEERYIVYDEASGLELWRGGGQPGSHKFVDLKEGQAVVVVPRVVVDMPVVDLNLLRGAMEVSLDADAERFRQLFLTPGDGQAMTYIYKGLEARAWLADNQAPTPFLNAEAAARSMTVADLAAEVIARANSWAVIGSAIEGLRMGAKAALAQATNITELVSASKVEWGAAVAPAS